MKRKLAGVFGMTLLAFVGLLTGITVINAREGNRYAQQVLSQSQQQYSNTTIPFRRGTITDRNGTVLLAAGSFTVLTKEALDNFLLIAGRFINISLLFSLLVQTSRSEEILLALEWFRLPPSAAMVLSIASRFIPELAATFHQIRESQSLRLPSPDEEGQRRRPFASILPSLVSAVVSALRSIPLTAGAIDLRGYGRKEKRTHYKILELRGKTLFTHFAVSLSIALIIFMLGRLL